MLLLILDGSQQKYLMVVVLRVSNVVPGSFKFTRVKTFAVDVPVANMAPLPTLFVTPKTMAVQRVLTVDGQEPTRETTVSISRNCKNGNDS